MEINSYRCPSCKNESFVETENGILCSNGHLFYFSGNRKIPIFDSAKENTNEYTADEAATIHDNALKWLFATFGDSEENLRKKLISRLHLVKGQRILITGVGAGNDLPYLAQLIGKEGIIFSQDYSQQMLMSAAERANSIFNLAEYNIQFSISDATNLPFPDDTFDAAYHFGGINLFSSIPQGIHEMDRVVKNGGRVVFGDEGLPSWLKHTEYGKMIINNNPLCDFTPPLDHLPPTAREVKLSWEVGYCFYVIEYTTSSATLPINIDIPHLGTRGGTIRSRYFGKLEGIDPDLKELLYAEAKKQGISRVEFIESLLRQGLKTRDPEL